ncbi:MAG TPA: magnesium transporter [Thermodesulfobacteriota bacterium]
MMNGNSPLFPYVEKFFEYDPLTATRALETMDEDEAIEILKNLPPSVSVKIFHNLQVNYAAALLKEIPTNTFKEIVENLSPEQGAAIIVNIPEDIRKRLLECLSNKSRQMIQELLIFPVDSAGRIMTTNFIAFRTDIKVKDAIQRIRSLAFQKQTSSYVYVVDNGNRLVGVLNMRDLLLASPEAKLESAMIKDVFTINAFTDREEVANQLSSRRYFAAPVVDSDNKLLGIVNSDQLLSHVQQEATEDIQKMFGAGGNERVYSSIWFSLKKRLPWLHINLATAFLAGSVVSLFQDTIAKIAVLAVFLPVIAGQSGNAGLQSLAVVMRGLVMREIPPKNVPMLLIKEAKIGIFNGIIIGFVTAFISWIWKGKRYLGLVIGLAMILTLIIAGLAGAIIPLAMKTFGLDPAQSSSIILTTVTDVVGFFVFLSFAVIFQSYLI